MTRARLGRAGSRLDFARMRMGAFLGASVLATGALILAPAATSAHGRAHAHTKPSTVESGSGPTSEPTSAESSSAESPAGESPSGESGSGAPRRERRARHEDAALSACQITLAGPTSAVAAGAPLNLSGALSCAEAASVEGQTVYLYQKAAHTTGFVLAATATTEAGGAFKLTLTGPEADSIYYVVCDGAKSPRTAVAISVQVTIESPVAGSELYTPGPRVPTGAGGNSGAGDSANSSTGDNADSGAGDNADSDAGDNGGNDANSAVTLTGTVTPAVPGETVTLQREYRPGAWHRIGVGQIGEEGKYAIAHTFLRAGEAHLRVVVHAHGAYMSASAPVTYRIVRPSRSGSATGT